MTSSEALSTSVHVLDLDVQIFDTDCFGVMWHGAYTKWLEMGRVRLFEAKGLRLSTPDEPEGWVYPVIDQHLQFKAPAKMSDRLRLQTRLRIEGYKLLFEQTVCQADTGKITLQALTTVVVLNRQWQLQRRLPDEILGCLL